MKCTSCGVGEVVEDFSGAETTMVCNECGCVEKGCEATNTWVNDERDADDPQDSNWEKKYKVHFSRLCRSQVLQEYLDVMKNVIDLFAMKGNAEIYKLAVNIFLAVDKKFLHGKGIKLKMQCAGICAHTALVQNNILVTIGGILKAMDVPAASVFKTLDMIHSTITEIAPSYLERRQRELAKNTISEDMKLTLKTIPCMKNRPDIIKKALDLVSLIYDINVATGRKSLTVVSCAAYLAFLAESKTRKKITLHHFLVTNDMVDVFGGVHSCWIEVQARLLVLVKRLPWMKGKNVKKEKVHFFLNDILRFKTTLLSQRKRANEVDVSSFAKVAATCSQTLCENNIEKRPVSVKTEAICESVNTLPSQNTSQTINVSTKLQKVPNKKYKRTEVCKPRTKVMRSSDVFTGSELLNPPSYLQNLIQPKRKKIHEITSFPVASTSETLTEDDLPEAELQKYLRTPLEIEQAAKIQELLEKC
ncbi:transcription factor IIIB 50 kDa subunit-like [Clavelina lepadiformis]|uniref:transcription factor IIIB 50 kDa subunit-like n=1 Tax=Clavelina lepadiformis TaxID=159417 RepID=UPI00404238AC